MDYICVYRCQDGQYQGMFPDFPGLRVLAKDMKQFLCRANAMLTTTMATLLTEGRDIPEPTTLIDFRACKEPGAAPSGVLSFPINPTPAALLAMVTGNERCKSAPV